MKKFKKSFPLIESNSDIIRNVTEFQEATIRITRSKIETMREREGERER